MRVLTLAALGVTTALLALPGCSPSTAPGRAPATPLATTAPYRDGNNGNGAPLSSATLETRLLTQHDLGDGYIRSPESSTVHDDITVLGCPALRALGGEAATGGSLSFARRAKTGFANRSSRAELSEELYSDTADALSAGTNRIFDTMTGCPSYRVLVGGTTIGVSTQELDPPALGDEQWSQLMTFTADGRNTVVKQTAVRVDNVLVVLSGSPACAASRIPAGSCVHSHQIDFVESPLKQPLRR
jgi:hypothetical protein